MLQQVFDLPEQSVVRGEGRAPEIIASDTLQASLSPKDKRYLYLYQQVPGIILVLYDSVPVRRTVPFNGQAVNG